MEEVTRELLTEWFGTDNGISNTLLEELNTELSDARAAVFEEFGFN